MTQNMTHFNQKELLQKLGLEEREIIVYETLLNRGPFLHQSIAKVTGIKRTTLYAILTEMLQKELIFEFTQGKRQLFQAVSPDKLFDEYERKYKELKTGIESLLTVYRMQGMKPKIEVFEGIEGIKRVYIDTLEVDKEVLVYNRMYRFDKEMLDWVKSYFIPHRIKKRIKVRAIVTAEKAGFEHMPSEKFRQTRFVPYEKFPLRIENMIYGDKVCFLSVEAGGPIVAVLIESKQIAQAQRALFELAWEGAEKYQ